METSTKGLISMHLHRIGASSHRQRRVNTEDHKNRWRAALRGRSVLGSNKAGGKVFLQNNS